MKVTILNPEVVRNLAENHGQFACVCYGTDEKRAFPVGKHCEKNGHWSGSRCEYIKFKIEDVDRGTCEQMLRHEIGVSVPYAYSDNWNFSDIDCIPADQIVKNMASFRYIDKDGFKWATPSEISKCEEAYELYSDTMAFVNRRRKMIMEKLIADGVSKESANEAANMLLPRATLSEFVIGFTPEALIRFMHKRLCNRAQEFINVLTILMQVEVKKLNPTFASYLECQCEHLLWCPEGKNSCGIYPTKEQLVKQLAQGKGEA